MDEKHSHDQPTRRKLPGDPTALATATKIDRRTCKRIVPMKVMCFGLSRTGTSSMRQALLDLGYNDVYHFSSVLNENPPDADMWIEAFEAKYLHKGEPFGRREWDMLLGHCMAITDTPCIFFYKELLEAYPHAKIILTVRDSPQQWFKSQMSTIMPFCKDFVMPPTTFAGKMFRYLFLPPVDNTQRLSWLITTLTPLYSTLLADTTSGTREALKLYDDHIEEIKKLVPKERLLIMNTKEGWEQLCRFLGKEAPAWEFPRVNSTADFNANLEASAANMGEKIRVRMMKMAAVTVTVFLGLAAAWYRWW